MRIITLNANGIRAAARKGFFEWMHKQDADVICIQETKAQHDQLTDRHFSHRDIMFTITMPGKRVTAVWRFTAGTNPIACITVWIGT